MRVYSLVLLVFWAHRQQGLGEAYSYFNKLSCVP